eukprot:9514563-Alexandrium_andersonii.AAC.1
MLHVPVSRAPMAKDCADCRLADCGLELATSRFQDLGTPLSPSDSASLRKVSKPGIGGEIPEL